MLKMREMEGKLHSRTIFIILVIILFSLTSPKMFTIGNAGRFDEDPYQISTSESTFTSSDELMSKEPFQIRGDEDFAQKAAEEGWPGDGEKDDPYIIDGYEIEVTDDYGILISNVRLYFVLRNCYIHSGGTWRSGIVLDEVQNARLENNILLNNRNGISLQRSYHNIVVENYLNGNGAGIYITESSYNDILKNNGSDNSNGVRLINSDNNIISFNDITGGISNTGIRLEKSNSNDVYNNNISSTSTSIRVINSENNVIRNNNLTENSVRGVYLDESSSNNIIENTINSCGRDGIVVRKGSYNHINNNTIKSSSEVGISLSGTKHNVVDNNTVKSNNRNGIRLSWSSKNNIVENRVLFNKGNGFYFRESSENTISNNIIESNDDHGIALRSNSNHNIFVENSVKHNEDHGIYLINSNQNRIDDNNFFHNNRSEIYIRSSDKTKIYRNSITNNRTDIILFNSKNAVLSENRMERNGVMIRSSGAYVVETPIEITTHGEDDHLHWTTHKIDTTNRVNGKPVYYWTNRTEGTVPDGAGQVILANCTGVTVKNQNIIDVNVGILLGYSEENLIIHNKLSGNREGINLAYSHNNRISSNIVSSNENTGIILWRSSKNLVQKNTINSNELSGIALQGSIHNEIIQNEINSNQNGIFIKSWLFEEVRPKIFPHLSYNNTVTMNTVDNNEHGIYLKDATNNEIYHNNIIDNDVQAFDNSYNEWNSSDSGNYWSDWDGGEKDGIIDEPRPIEGGDNYDEYPLAEPVNLEQEDEGIFGYWLVVLIAFILIAVVSIWWLRKSSDAEMKIGGDE